MHINYLWRNKRVIPISFEEEFPHHDSIVAGYNEKKSGDIPISSSKGRGKSS